MSSEVRRYSFSLLYSHRKTLNHCITTFNQHSVILPALLQPDDFSSKYLPELLKNLTLTKENDQQNSDFQLSLCGSLRQSTEHN
jgi:hypothetical protein